MTLEEALAILDVPITATPDERRRAYLRLLKKHKPEVDPEGFARLREAYELASQWVGLDKMLADSPDLALSAPSLAPARDPAPPPSDATAIPPLDTQLPVQTTEPAVDPALLAANRELELALRVGERTRALVNEGKNLAAAIYLRNELEEAEFSCVPLLPAGSQFSLRLIRDGEAAEGRRLVEALQKNLSDTGSELAGLRAAGPGWLVARELAALPFHFDQDMRRALAEGYLVGDMQHARQQFVDYIGKSADRARILDDLLEAAPTVHAHLNLVFRKAQPIVSKPSQTWWPAWTAFIVLTALARNCPFGASGSNQTDTGSYQPASPLAAPTPMQRVKFDGNQLAQAARRNGRLDIHEAAMKFLGQVDYGVGACGKINDAHWVLSGIVRDTAANDAELTTLAGALEANVRKLCPPGRGTPRDD